MKKIFLAVLFISGFLIAQQKTHFIVINKTDSADEIIKKAANVVPKHEQYEWQKLEFIAFVHFGINTFTDSEWGEGNEDPKLFNPTKLDAEQWARTFKEAGMKLVILTAKHHDGFCLWPSKFTEHSVKNSHWKNGKGDVVLEFVDACRKYDLKVGLYLSPWDRNNPNYGDSPKYNEYFINQLTELLTNYGEITEIWFDGACGEGPNGKKQIYDWQAYYKVIRKLQPNAVIFGMSPDLRWVGTETGVGRETEWSVVSLQVDSIDKQKLLTDKFSLDEIYKPVDMTDYDLGSREKIMKSDLLFWYPAETDVSIRPGWFYHQAQDKEVKLPEKLVDIYFSSVGRNGVLLLNVPPNKDGLISDYDIKSLREMKKILDETFKTNLALESEIISTDMKRIDEKYWIAQKSGKSVKIEFKMKEEKSFNVVMLQEEIQIGQRIEKFHLDYWNGTEWQKFAEGTTVGYKRLLRFDKIKSNRVRLVIEESRLNPTLAYFGLYKVN